MMLRRTKIVATLGPASDREGELKAMLLAGVNVVRLNFSHGTHQDHINRIQAVRKLCAELAIEVGILADLQGPKIRVACFRNSQVELSVGQSFILDTAHPVDAGDQTIVGVDYQQLHQDVFTGDTLLLNDGLLSMKVVRVKNTQIHCEVINGGCLSNHKGINRAGGGLSAGALTDKDRADLRLAVAQQVNYIALSFVRNTADIKEAQQLIQKADAQLGTRSDIGIIAKIERAEALDCIEDIIVASDGIMVARGDLALEIGAVEVPAAQKRMIRVARSLDRPVITATQMMESMIENPVPTRAEVSDVANSVLDGTDAVMLSAETAAGKHPSVVVKAMSEICVSAEKQPSTQVSRHRVECQFERVDEAIAMATMYTANHLGIAAIIALTESGKTPLWMSRIRTCIPIFGLSRNATSRGKMTLYRGVYPMRFDATSIAREQLNQAAIEVLRAHQFIQQDQLVILTKGDQQGVDGGSNAMKVLRVG